MERQVKARFIRIAPRKARVVMNLIRGKSVGEALELLKFTSKAAAKPISKVIESAVEDIRKKDPTVNVDAMKIVKGWVDQGPAMKRRLPRARGYSTLIKKYFSHIGMVLSD